MSVPDRPLPRETLARLSRRSLAVVVLGCAAGLIANAVHPMGLPLLLGAVPHPGIPAWVWHRVEKASPQQAHRLWLAWSQTGRDPLLFVDVRDGKDYAQDHIPGSLSLPYHEFTTTYPRVRGQLPPQARLVIYCYGSHCGLSMRVAKRLLVLGHQRLTVVQGGIAAWRQAGYELDRGTAPKPGPARQPGRAGQ